MDKIVYFTENSIGINYDMVNSQPIYTSIEELVEFCFKNEISASVFRDLFEEITEITGYSNLDIATALILINSKDRG